MKWMFVCVGEKERETECVSLGGGVYIKAV